MNSHVVEWPILSLSLKPSFTALNDSDYAVSSRSAHQIFCRKIKCGARIDGSHGGNPMSSHVVRQNSCTGIIKVCKGIIYINLL